MNSLRELLSLAPFILKIMGLNLNLYSIHL